MMEKVESLFSEYFTSNDHGEALIYLKATRKKNSQQLMFLLGVYQKFQQIIDYIETLPNYEIKKI